METQSKLFRLFEEELQDIYWAEKHLAKALVKVAKAATSHELQKAIETHQVQTDGHVVRLEEIFDLLGRKATAKKCEAMSGLLDEAEEIIQDTEEDTMVRDCGIIIAAQKVEHYEIASYGCLKALANMLGEPEVSELLGKTLQEEKQTDTLLTQIAESFVNQEANNE